MRVDSRKISITPPTLQNTCAVIVTFHPDSGLAKRLKELICPRVSAVVIVNNSPETKAQNATYKNISPSTIHLVENNANLGIAKALNIGMAWAKDQGFLWSLTLDQDSEPNISMVETLCSIFNEIQAPTAIIGSNYVEKGSGILKVRLTDSSTSWVERKTLITSGSLMSLEAYSQIGPFRDNFFIDAVDHDYCMRARQSGFKIVMCLKPLMEHPIGSSKAHSVFFIPGLKVSALNHSALRWYFISRNALILVLEYIFKDPLWAILRLIRLGGIISIMCLFEENRLTKLRWILLGFWDGIRLNTNRKIVI